MRPQLVADAFGVLGCVAIVEGARRIYEPAAFLVGGAFLVALAVLLSRGGGKS